MRKPIRITESTLRSMVLEAVRKIISEGAYDKYQDDLMDIELDSNMNVNRDSGMASAYAQMNDPMVRNMHGSTARDMMSDRMGNDVNVGGGDYDDIDPKAQDAVVDKWLNTPNAATNYKEFPRRSRSNGGVKNYDSLANNGSRFYRR